MPAAGGALVLVMLSGCSRRGAAPPAAGELLLLLPLSLPHLVLRRLLQQLLLYRLGHLGGSWHWRWGCK